MLPAIIRQGMGRRTRVGDPTLVSQPHTLAGIGLCTHPRTLYVSSVCTLCTLCRHNVEVRHLWGMTELTPLGTLGGLKAPLTNLPRDARIGVKMMQGRPHALCEMRVVDDEGTVSV